MNLGVCTEHSTNSIYKENNFQPWLDTCCYPKRDLKVIIIIIIINEIS